MIANCMIFELFKAFDYLKNRFVIVESTLFKGKDIDRYLKSIYAEQELTEKFPEKKKLERQRKNIEKERKCLHDIFCF